MIVDDSALVRETLKRILEQDKSIKVIATASDPIIALKKLDTNSPDVIILDIEMPRMDGLTFLKKIRTEFNIPVIFEPTQYYTARWIECEDKLQLQKFMDSSMANIADDHDGAKVFLARNAWHLGKVAEDFPKIVLRKTREQIF